MAEQRDYPRYQISVAAEVSVNDGEETVSGEAIDVSLGGLGLRCRQLLPEGEIVTANLYLVEDGIEAAGTPSLNARARVVWATDEGGGSYHIGLSFRELDGPQQAVLHAFLGSLAR